MQWAARPLAHDLDLGRRGLPQRDIRGERDEALQLIVELSDPLQIRLSQFYRRQFMPGYAARGVGEGCETQLHRGHVIISPRINFWGTKMWAGSSA